MALKIWVDSFEESDYRHLMTAQAIWDPILMRPIKGDQLRLLKRFRRISESHTIAAMNAVHLDMILYRMARLLMDEAETTYEIYCYNGRWHARSYQLDWEEQVRACFDALWLAGDLSKRL